MKNGILVAGILCIFFAHGMENSNGWSITSYGTRINLTKGSILDADGRVDVVVAGNNQQRMLVNSNGWIVSKIGDLSYFDCVELFVDDIKHGLWVKNKEDDSVSDDNTDNLFENDKDINFEDINTKGHKVFFKTTTKSVYITEPCIRYKNSSFLYSVERPNPDSEKIYNCLLFRNEEAFEQATKDLDMCYAIVLQRVLVDLSEKKERSIALHTLSTEVGFPRKKAAPIAIKAVLKFIKNNFGAYNRIELFVRKRFEFDLYKELLQKGCKLPTSILLLCIAMHKDLNSSFQIFPREIIYDIAKLVNICLKDVDA